MTDRDPESGFAFGYGSFVHDIRDTYRPDPDNPQEQVVDGFFERSQRDQALLLGRAIGCPVTRALTDPKNEQPGRGPEAMVARYATLGFWFGEISRRVQQENPKLHATLMAGMDRKLWEPVGVFEPESVPDNYREHMAPMNTLVGYALPRLFIDHVYTGSEEGRVGRLTFALEHVEFAAKLARNPAQLLVMFGQAVANAGNLGQIHVLQRVFSQAWFDEHRAWGMLDNVKTTMYHTVPGLWEAYMDMPPAERAQRGLA